LNPVTSLQNIVTLSIIVTVCASVKSTNVVWPQNGTYDVCIFRDFLTVLWTWYLSAPNHRYMVRYCGKASTHFLIYYV